ncbi:effector-associated domain EAD1-containing protein [Streptomyces aureus]|uniref:effector-associated domain EAD1-containing protein n=1 Tax=Streptomyces aureus TaxID=193461 RepID=UPI0005611B9C|nr:effector-associated domain EAD1-containing protein [Streptomyces aureus]
MPLDGRVAERFSEALMDSFQPEQLRQFLYYRLDKQLHRISMKPSYDAVVFDVIRAADSEGWLDRLVSAARKSRPGHAGLFLTAQNLGLAVETDGLESILNIRAPEIHPTLFRAGLGVIEGRVCRVEVVRAGMPHPLGTGFLVGPDLCLTSFHVVEGLFDGRLRPDEVRLRFDHKLGAGPGGGLGALSEPRPEKEAVSVLAEHWCVASAPYGDADRDPAGERTPAAGELDFALLRLADSPGSRPIGDDAEPSSPERGWLDTRAPVTLQQGDDIVVFQHLLGGPMRLSFGKVIEVTANGTRIRHTADTDRGSSGSPCFTLALDLAAIHQAGDPRQDSWHVPAYNRAVPIAPVVSTFPPGTAAPQC